MAETGAGSQEAGAMGLWHRMQPCPMDCAAPEPAAPAEGRVGMTKGDETPGEFVQVLVEMSPVNPREFVVLAIRIVVAPLAAAELVAGDQHGYALREHQRYQEIALLPGTQGQHFGIVGGPFDAAVPGAVVIGAVAVAFAN